jgi:hypothetical protein
MVPTVVVELVTGTLTDDRSGLTLAYPSTFKVAGSRMAGASVSEVAVDKVVVEKLPGV